MIIGIFLRNIKTYQGLNYIPLSDETNFSGLLGNNGVGKSSVLESLDCFFNAKTWNFNTVVKKSGLTTTNPHIVPVFMLKKSVFDQSELDYAENLSSIALGITEDDASNSQTKSLIKQFVEHRNRIVKKNNLDDYVILPIGVDHSGNLSLSIFSSRLSSSARSARRNTDDINTQEFQSENDEMSVFKPVLKKIKSHIEYIYIPKEIDPDSFTKLETNEIQTLMGEKLSEIIDNRIGTNNINGINTALNDFLSQIESELDGYTYRTPTDRQQNIKKNDVYNLIIQTFFNIRKLHKKHGESWLEINALSSGEKQKAIISVAHSLLTKHRTDGSYLIIAVDEPEASLHMSACFEQFNSLFEISKNCMQLIFTSHWYGFLPTIESGCVSVINKSENNHQVDLINLASYREEIKQLNAVSKGKLPFDIRLKSMNDFVQSIITSAMGTEPYNWIICEGTSEKIYLTKYLEDIISEYNIRIVPVGGAKEIKRIYNYLSSSYDDYKDQVSGVIILLSDTDSELVNYSVKEQTGLKCKRIVNVDSERKTKLVNIDSNPVSPKTVIEDVLNGQLFYECLMSFRPQYPMELGFLSNITAQENCVSYFSLDITPTQSKKILDFFEKDNNKFKFAQEYISRINSNHYVPDWISQLRNWIVK
ncbi:ATP-binding protein [Yersinia enterocolitica]|nr:AAA family ATPase [Yersinia enterocolitica]EKN6048867.1 ATP-binding protein [Yersinia enterocolitica]